MRRSVATATVVALVTGLLSLTGGGTLEASVVKLTSSVEGSDGKLYTVTNHLVDDALTAEGDATAREYLLVWTGDWNGSDQSAHDIRDRAGRIRVDPIAVQNELMDDSPGPDFLAVIDADPESADYGKVVNTVTVPMLPFENEPHHMQYVWHKGDKVFAGGLFGDTAFVFDVSNVPVVEIVGTILPADTPCGSVPDAFWALGDGSALGTWMGGPNIPGPCAYTNGETRMGNGFAGTPGSLVRIGDGDGDGTYEVLAELPSATDLPVDTDMTRCPTTPTNPSLTPTTGSAGPNLSAFYSCANPHGIQFREDLNAGITTDYAEPRNVPTDPARPVNEMLFRDTVRIWKLDPSQDFGAAGQYDGCGVDLDCSGPAVADVKAMPDGPRVERNPGHEEPRGIMEGTVTNAPSKGAFSESMCGGVVYYTADFTDPNAEWVEVFDDTAAARLVNPDLSEAAGCNGGGWVHVSPSNDYLYHAVIGRNEGSLSSNDKGVPKMVYVLDIRKLLEAGDGFDCQIDSMEEVWGGGAEDDCPHVAGVIELPDETSGGPHWGALDNFKLDDDSARETTNIRRFAASNYFVARSSVDGNHKVCMVHVDENRRGDDDGESQGIPFVKEDRGGEEIGILSLDRSFLDENHGTPCVDFNRSQWPHGRYGNAKPHSSLFVVPEAIIED